MPTIPLISNTQPLKDLPDPVLDRERRPSVDYRGMMQGMAEMTAASRMPLINPNALSAPYEGMQAIGEAVGRAGSVVGAVAIKRMEAESDVQVSEAEALIQQTQADFEKWRLENPDHTKWVPEWERRMGLTRTQILEDPRLHNLAYNQLLPRLTSYESSSKINVDLMATKSAFAQAKGAYLTRANRAIETQNHGEMRAIHQEGQGKGYLSGDDVAAGERLYAETAEKRQRTDASALARGLKETVRKEIDTAPDAYLEKYRGQEKGREREIAYATKRSWEKKTRAIDEIVGQTRDRGIEFGVEVELWNNKDLPDEIRTAHKDYVKGREYGELEREDPEEYKRLDIEDRLARVDPNEKDKLQRYYEITRDIQLGTTGNTASELMNRAREKFGLKAEKLPERSPVEKLISATGAKIFNPYFGDLAWDRVEMKTVDGKKVPKRETDFEKRRKMLMAQAEWEKTMNDAVKQQPEYLRRPDDFARLVQQALPTSIQAMVVGSMVNGGGVAAAMPAPAGSPGQSANLISTPDVVRAMQKGGQGK